MRWSYRCPTCERHVSLPDKNGLRVCDYCETVWTEAQLQAHQDETWGEVLLTGADYRQYKQMQAENEQLRARAERAEAWLGKFLAIDESPTSIYFNENVAIAFIRLQIECQAALAQPDAADAGDDAT
jgi:hypothetical protein